MKKPKIGITTGDLNGVGLEVVLNTLSDIRISNLCTPIIYGSEKIISLYKKLAKVPDIRVRSINNIDHINPKNINIMEVVKTMPRITLGSPSEATALYAFESLKAASQDLQKNVIDALITSPVDKATISKAIKTNFVGQTEYLESLSKNKSSIMMFVSPAIRLALVTNHVGISELPKAISVETIVDKAKILNSTLIQDFWIEKPKIAILGFNPHAGDNNLLGSEENEKIIPAINELIKQNILIHGPYPADSFFSKKIYQRFDATLAIYHDQGLIPFKLLSDDSGVNYTAGLEFIRTSPDHGVAYNIAGKQMADNSSFRQAIYTAIDIAKLRSEQKDLLKNPLAFGGYNNYTQNYDDKNDDNIDEDDL